MSKPRFFKRICDKCQRHRTHDRRLSISICKGCAEIAARKRELHYAEHVRPDYTKLHDDIRESIRLMEERHNPPGTDCKEPHSSQDAFGGRTWACKNPCPPRIEQTEAGPQTVAPGTPAHTIPTNGLCPKVAQKEGPLPLELAEIDARQEKLF